MRHLSWAIPAVISFALILWGTIYNPYNDHLQMAAFVPLIVSCTLGIAMLLEPRKRTHPGDTDPYFDKPQIMRKHKPVEYRIYRNRVLKEKSSWEQQ